MSNLVSKKSSFVDKLIDDLLSIDWGKIDFPVLCDGLCSTNIDSMNGFEEIDGKYVMEHDFGVEAKDSNIKVNVDENVLEVSSEYEWSDDNSSRKTSNYFSTTLPKDADEDTIEAKLGKDGKLKITVEKIVKVDVDDDEPEEQTINVTKNKKN